MKKQKTLLITVIQDIAEQLFLFVDWQHPNIQDFLEGYSEVEFLEDWGFSIDELQNCCANSNGMV